MRILSEAPFRPLIVTVASFVYTEEEREQHLHGRPFSNISTKNKPMNVHPQVLYNLSRITLSRAKRALSDWISHGEAEELWNHAKEIYPDSPQVDKRTPFNITKIE